MYKDIEKPEIIKGLKIWKNKGNRFTVCMLHYTADPDKDPERDGKEWFENEKAGTPLASWNKEYEIDFTTKSGKLVFGPEFCDYRRDVHLINSYELDGSVELLISLDFGQRNPTCALVGAWTHDKRLIIIGEYYKPALPSVSSKEMMIEFKEFIFPGLDEGAIRSLPLEEKRRRIDNAFQLKLIDPTTQAKNRTKKQYGEEIEYSVIEEFADHGWDFEPGNNPVQAGITRMREFMQINPIDGKTHLYIFKDKCPHLVWELEHYRYKEKSEIQLRSNNESEEVVKKNDHAPDALRLMIMSRPYEPAEKQIEKSKIQKDIQKLYNKQQTGSTPSWDLDD